MKLIPLSMWAERRYGRVPSSRTLRRWAHSGHIIPRPKKEGRTLMVPENAIYVDFEDPDYERDLADLRESSPQ